MTRMLSETLSVLFKAFDDAWEQLAPEHDQNPLCFVVQSVDRRRNSLQSLGQR